VQVLSNLCELVPLEKARALVPLLEQFDVGNVRDQRRFVFGGQLESVAQGAKLAIDRRDAASDPGSGLADDVELITRLGLAWYAGNASDVREALPHLERRREIVSNGENWFGLTGWVEHDEAAAAQGQHALAETQFKRAIATFQRYCLPWEEADTLQD
jgi:hypothetical protein